MSSGLSQQSSQSSASLVAYRSAANDRFSGSRHASSAGHVRAGVTDCSIAFTDLRPRQVSISTWNAAFTTLSVAMSMSMSVQWNMMPEIDVRPFVSVHEKWFFSAPTARQ